MSEYSKMTIEDLLAVADSGQPNSDEASHVLRVAEIKASLRANELTEQILDSEKATRALMGHQIEVGLHANELTKELLDSNRRSSEASEKNAASLNHATEALANSTSGLKSATWILAIFTGVQVLIAAAELWMALRGK